MAGIISLRGNENIELKPEVLIGINSNKNITFVFLQAVLDTISKYLNLSRTLVFINTTNFDNKADLNVQGVVINELDGHEQFSHIEFTRYLFKNAVELNADAVLLLNGDNDFDPLWMKILLEPILQGEASLVIPYFTHSSPNISNKLIYKLLRALYGYHVKSPGSGNYAVSRSFIKHMYKVNLSVGKHKGYAIDVWLIINAIKNRFSIKQVYLGNRKENSVNIAEQRERFVELLGEIFDIFAMDFAYWSNPGPEYNRTNSEQLVENCANKLSANELEQLYSDFRSGFKQYALIWKEVLHENNFAYLSSVYRGDRIDFAFERFARIVYDFAVNYVTREDRELLINALFPISSLMIALQNKESERLGIPLSDIIERAARAYETEKYYIVGRWSELVLNKQIYRKKHE